MIKGDEMILDIYKDSFEYAGQDIMALLKLGILSLLSFLVLPTFLLSGYQYRVIDLSINGMVGGDDKLPAFDNWTDMFVDGIKYFLVQVLYLVVPAIVLFVLAFLGLYCDVPVLVAIALVVGIILFIISELYEFVAIPNMIANDGSFKSAFDFKRLTEVIKMIGVGKYVVFYIGIILLIIVISIVVAFILLAIFGLFGIAVSTVLPAAGLGIIGAYSIIFSAIFSFIVGPYLSIFAGRGTGLIYAVGE